MMLAPRIGSTFIRRHYASIFSNEANPWVAFKVVIENYYLWSWDTWRSRLVCLLLNDGRFSRPDNENVNSQLLFRYILLALLSFRIESDFELLARPLQFRMEASLWCAMFNLTNM
jgi:hypothetical protein